MKSQDMQNKNNKLQEELEELKSRLEELKFYDENNFGELFDKTAEFENKIETFKHSVWDLIERQSENHQHHTDGRDKAIWFASSLSKMIRINKIMEDATNEVNQM